MTSTRVVQSVAVAGMLLGVTQAARAQSCMGLPSLSAISRSVSTVADAYGSERAILGRAGMSSLRSFAGLQAGYVGDKVQDPRRVVFGFDAGLTLPLGKAPKMLQMCPLVQSLMQLSRGPDAFGNRTTHTLVGLSIGQEFKVSSRVAIAPFVDGALSRWGYHYGSPDLYVTDPALNPTPSGHGSETGGRFGAGVGLRLGEALTIRPAFHFTGGFRNSGGDANQPGATLSISYGFRRR